MTTTEPMEIDDRHVKPMQRFALVVGRAISFVVYAFVLLVEVILGLGFLMLLLGANPNSSFVEWVYRSLDRTMRPFRGIFEPVEIGLTANDVPSVFETSVLFAMIVYAIVALAIHAVLSWLTGHIGRLDRADEQYRREQIIRQTMTSQQPVVPPDAAPQPPTPTTTPTDTAPPNG
jgi:uncharacterized protein YggT (Ycf19 family)